MDRLLSGKEVARNIRRSLKVECEGLRKSGVIPALSIIRVGEKQEDIYYEKAVKKVCEEIGAYVSIELLPEDVSYQDFTEVLNKLNTEPSIHGIMIFRPLPAHLHEEQVKKLINPAKDIDCMNPANLLNLFESNSEELLPCTPSAVVEILRYYDIHPEGKNAVIIGRSMVVGKPLSLMLLAENATVTVCHSKTGNIKEIASKADILVAALGKERFVKADFVKEGAIVIDVGVNTDAKGELCGDVDFDEVVQVAGGITPVPGGVGSVTTSVLLKNLIRALKKQRGIL